MLIFFAGVLFELADWRGGGQSTGGGGADIFNRETSQVILVPSQLFKTFTISLISSLFFIATFISVHYPWYNAQRD